MHVIILMTRFVTANTELDFQGALLRVLTARSYVKNSLMKRMS